MPLIMTKVPLLLGLVAGFAATELQAQRSHRDPSASEIATLLRTKGWAAEARDILTQVRGPRPRSTLDEIADTLAAVAIAHPGSGVDAERVRGTAVQTLMHAGRGNGGVPYPGAAERLLRIVEADPANGGGALFALTVVSNQAQARQFMRQVAISDSKLAYAAVGHLARSMGPEGLALLRGLYQQGLIREPLARQHLGAIAKHHGWP